MVRPGAPSQGTVAMTDRRPTTTSARKYAATLSCGLVLTYESLTFLPGVGETVPCHRHGYCSVDAVGRGPSNSSQDSSRSRPRRSQAELLAFLKYCPVTTVHILRKNRFTLRTVAAAQADGLVEADLVAGRVALRPPAD
jgi:hypothetical protein